MSNINASFLEKLIANRFIRPNIYNIPLVEGKHYKVAIHTPMFSSGSRVEMKPTAELNSADILQHLNGDSSNHMPGVVLTGTNRDMQYDPQVVFDFKRQWLENLAKEYNKLEPNRHYSGIITDDINSENRLGARPLHHDSSKVLAWNIYGIKNLEGGHPVVGDYQADLLRRKHHGIVSHSNRMPEDLVKTLDQLDYHQDMPIIAINDELAKHTISPVQLVLPSGKRVSVGDPVARAIEKQDPYYFQRLVHVSSIPRGSYKPPENQKPAWIRWLF